MRLLTFTLALCLTAVAHAGIEDADTNGAFLAGLRAFESGEFETAVEILEQVLRVEPDCGRCAHVLGRSYGRLAEQASWFSAMGLAEKTRDALEQAVRLDPTNIAAIEDLIRYYRAAPGFLGGSAEKARKLERRLDAFRADRTS